MNELNHVDQANALREELFRKFTDLLVGGKISRDEFARLTSCMSNMIYHERMDVHSLYITGR